jgi:hypothetical protein
MLATIQALTERLAHIEREVSEMRRELEAFLSAQTDSRAWARLSESTFAKDWDNEQDAVYDNWRELYGVPS